MSHPDSSDETTLLDTQLAFEHWHTHRTSARHATPKRLKNMAVALLEHHPKSLVCKTLSLNHVVLKSWATADIVEPVSEFVSLPPDTPSCEPTQKAELKIVLPNGTQVHAFHSYSAKELLTALNTLARYS